MKTRSKLSILALFSCCAVASMGFANWVITQSPQTVTGGIKADNVILSNEYLYMVGEPSGLDYSPTGFKNGNSTSYTGTLTANYVLDIKNCRDIFGDSTIIAEISIGYNTTEVQEYNLFADDSYVKANVSNADFINSSAQTYQNDTLKLTLKINLGAATQNSANISITYTITLSEATFVNYFYTPFFGTDLAFEFNAQLRGGN